MTKHLSLYEILLSLRSDDFATLDPEELAEVTAELSPEERAKVHAWLQVTWSRLFGQVFRLDRWIVCRV